MMKLHEIIRPSVTKSFFEQTVDFWLGFDSGHMGPQMYQHHNGMRGATQMSGVATWAEHAQKGTLPALNRNAFFSNIQNIASYMETHLPIIEFGPGSMTDAIPLIDALDSPAYIPVDCSIGIIEEAKTLAKTKQHCAIMPAVVDFFSEENCPLVNKPALSVLLGLTIDNIPGPVPHKEPRDALVKAFKNLTKAMPAGGYFLVSTDVCQDGQRNRDLYSEHWHSLFGVNHLYRMAEELPMSGFDPEGFDYLPVWYKHCSLLAHTVRATKDQWFTMGENNEIQISIKKGSVYHYNNSFKYRPAFFEDCAQKAGLEVMDLWTEDSTIGLYLFRVPPQAACTNIRAPRLASLFKECPQSAAFAASRLARIQEHLHDAA